jgi:low affinity Fe/Cu permease
MSLGGDFKNGYPRGMRRISDAFSSFAQEVNAFCSSPSATALAFFVVIVWAASGPHFRYSQGWQLVINTGTTIVTFLMVFVLNNAQYRDTAAINAKLDGIIRAIDAADNRMIGLEKHSMGAAKEIRDDVIGETASGG